MATATVNGVTLHYQRRLGDGQTIVLLHGLATNLAFWYFTIVPLLSRDLSLVLYDLRGHGRSDMPRSGYTTADMAADLDGLLDNLEISRAHLIGHSYGGAVALHYAALHPARVASLILADARIRALQPTQRLKDWHNAPALERKLKDLQVSVALDDAEMGYQYLEAMAEAEVQGKDAARTKLGVFSPKSMNKTNRTAQRWLQLLRTTTALNDFKTLAGLTLDKICQVNQPVLAMFGQYSNCLPSCRGLKQHLPRCKVVIVPRTGHYHPIVRPAFFERKVRKFLGEAAR